MINWELIERGWYCSSLGGICMEHTGKWHCYPKKEIQDSIPSKIFFKTLAEAKKWFEEEVL